jgi:hypothetical protein
MRLTPPLALLINIGLGSKVFSIDKHSSLLVWIVGDEQNNFFDIVKQWFLRIRSQVKLELGMRFCSANSPMKLGANIIRLITAVRYKFS